jgi:hypothetical protein
MSTTAFASSDVLFNNACSNGSTENSAICQDDNQTNNPLIGSNGLVRTIANVIAVVAGATAVIVIIISGLRYITSGGDPAKAASARSALIFAVAGIVVIVLADSIISFVLSKL